MDKYILAIQDLAMSSEEHWLRKYFDLYQTTINWPVGLPPIPRSDYHLARNETKLAFHKVYYITLMESNLVIDYDSRSLVMQQTS